MDKIKKDTLKEMIFSSVKGPVVAALVQFAKVASLPF